MELDNTTIADLHRQRRTAMINRLHRRFVELDASDLVDEAFTIALAQPERIPADDVSPEAWINGIADNLARNKRRRNRSADAYEAAQPEPEDLLDPGFEDGVINAAVATAVLSAVAAILTDLDANDAALINATILTNLGAFAAFPMTSAARVQLHRIRKRLTAALGRSTTEDDG